MRSSCAARPRRGAACRSAAGPRADWWAASRFAPSRPPRQLLAKPRRQAAFELHRGVSRRREKGHLRAAHLVAQNDQRDGLVGREVRRRQELRPRQPITPVGFVVNQRESRFAENVEVAEDRPPADAAGRGERFGVISLSSLKQGEQSQQTLDSRQVHSADSDSGLASTRSAPARRRATAPLPVSARRLVADRLHVALLRRLDPRQRHEFGLLSEQVR